MGDNPLDTILNEVTSAMDAGLFYSAIAIALTVPDLCAALQEDSGRTNATRYVAWFEKYLGKKYSRLPGDAVYSLRCGVIHQGVLSHPKLGYSRIIFLLPNANIQAHNAILEDVLNLDPRHFCNDIISACHEWFDENKSNPSIQKNSVNVVRLHPKGLSPYISGLPVVA